jgi:hypothetical protein
MDEVLQERLQLLSDLDLAVLVSLISGEHCMCSTTPRINRDLRNELHLICKETFGLQTAILECSAKTTVDDFNEAILVDAFDDFEDAEERYASNPGFDKRNSTQGHTPGRFGGLSNTLDDRRIADVIIAANLDLASASVQVQALELLRTKRIFTRTAMHTASRGLLLLVVSSRPGARLSHHLNDLICMSHHHDEDHGLSHVEGSIEAYSLPSFSRHELRDLRNRAENVRLTGEVDAYLHNVVIFLRQSRYVKAGITAAATRYLRSVAKALAPLHGLDYVPPSLVMLAARKVYPHRMILATADTERSLQWGSDSNAIREILHGVTEEDVIETVLGSVDTPL